MKVSVVLNTTVRIKEKGDNYSLFVQNGHLEPLSVPLCFPPDVSKKVRDALEIDWHDLVENERGEIVGRFSVKVGRLADLRVMFAGWAQQCSPLADIVEALSVVTDGAYDAVARDAAALGRPHAYVFDIPEEPLRTFCDEVQMTVVRPLRSSVWLSDSLTAAQEKGLVARVTGREIVAGRRDDGVAIDRRARSVLDRAYLPQNSI